MAADAVASYGSAFKMVLRDKFANEFDRCFAIVAAASLFSECFNPPGGQIVGIFESSFVFSIFVHLVPDPFCFELNFGLVQNKFLKCKSAQTNSLCFLESSSCGR